MATSIFQRRKGARVSSVTAMKVTWQIRNEGGIGSPLCLNSSYGLFPRLVTSIEFRRLVKMALKLGSEAVWQHRCAQHIAGAQEIGLPISLPLRTEHWVCLQTNGVQCLNQNEATMGPASAEVSPV